MRFSTCHIFVYLANASLMTPTFCTVLLHRTAQAWLTHRGSRAWSLAVCWWRNHRCRVQRRSGHSCDNGLHLPLFAAEKGVKAEYNTKTSWSMLFYSIPSSFPIWSHSCRIYLHKLRTFSLAILELWKGRVKWRRGFTNALEIMCIYSELSFEWTSLEEIFQNNEPLENPWQFSYAFHAKIFQFKKFRIMTISAEQTSSADPGSFLR